MTKTDMTFVTGVVRSKEKDLIRSDTLRRMIDEGSAEGFLRFLTERGVGGGEEIASLFDYERLLTKEEEALIALLLSSSPDERYLTCALSENDYFNAECAVRKARGYLKTGGYLPAGTVSVEALEAAAAGDKNAADARFFLPMTKALSMLDENKASGRKLATLFLSARNEFRQKTAKDRDQILLFSAEADVKNLSVAFRSETAAKAEEEYLPGGTIKKEGLNLIADKEDEKAENFFRFTEIYPLVKIGLTERQAGIPFTAFERDGEGYGLKMLKKRRYENGGAFPLTLYTTYKKSEIKNVRIALSGLLNGAPPEKIKERLREGYDG